MSEKTVRVRFAPSPTGPLHMGGVRTALYNYLFARKHNGAFILRIEDTDQTRFVPGAEAYIQESLEWSRLTPDESPWKDGGFGPYRQSERKHLYQEYALQLVNSGHAYYAFDTEDDLNAMRDRAKQAKMPNWQYNHITRSSMKNSLTLSEDAVQERLEKGEAHVIRLKVPRNEEIRFHDEVRGWVVVNSSNVDDKVIFKSDGMPTYHLANIVDDHLMKITHVIRGEEWLPSAPLHVLLYRYLGWEDSMPSFAHLPLILRPDGNGKLSKRDGDRLGFPVFPINWDPEEGDSATGYRESGYFPEAFVNMLAFLGWNPGTPQELFQLPELVEAFSLDRVGKAGAKFDADKTRWFNQQYLRATPDAELAQQILPLVEKEGYTVDAAQLERIAGLLKERAFFPSDIVSEGVYFFHAPDAYDERTIKKKWKPETPGYLQQLRAAFHDLTDFSAESLEHTFQSFLQKAEIGFGQIGPALRVALTGQGMGPSLFEIMHILGKEEVLQRIDRALEKLS